MVEEEIIDDVKVVKTVKTCYVHCWHLTNNVKNIHKYHLEAEYRCCKCPQTQWREIDELPGW